MRTHYTAPGAATRSLAITSAILMATSLAVALPPSVATPVRGADKLFGYCDCATPNPNRRRRCRSCFRDLQPEAPPPRPPAPTFAEIEDCPFYVSLQVMSSDAVTADMARVVLREPGTNRRWMVQMDPTHFPVGWWTARVEGDDHRYPAFAHALETPPEPSTNP